MFEKFSGALKSLQERPGLRVATSLGVGMAVAVVLTAATPVGWAADAINDQTTTIRKTASSGAIPPPVIRPGPARSIQVSYPPCVVDDKNCYVEFTAETGFMSTSLTCVSLTLLSTLVVFFAIGHSRQRASMIKAAKVSYDITVDTNELFACTTTYRGLKTDEKGASLYIPLQLKYVYDPKDGSEVVITEVSATCLKEGTTAKLDPPFDPTVHKHLYDGSVVFDPPTKELDHVEVIHKVTKNMCLSLQALQQRWGTTESTDDYVVEAKCHWDEIEIQFHWPKGLSLSGQPNVSLRKLVGAPRKALKFKGWAANSWHLHATDVAPGAEFFFQWTLA